MKKLLIIGHARHGKDTAAEILNQHFGLTFKSSSECAAENFLFDIMNTKYGKSYKSIGECFADRMNNRKAWYDEICLYNSVDKIRLAKEVLSKADMYVGMRSHAEIEECKKQKLFDLIIWIDASERLPLESSDSFDITKEDADIIITNNTTLTEFTNKLIKIFKSYGL